MTELMGVDLALGKDATSYLLRDADGTLHRLRDDEVEPIIENGEIVGYLLTPAESR